MDVVSAQWGLRASYGEFEYYSPDISLFASAGIDHDTSPRTAVAIGLGVDMSKFTMNDERSNYYAGHVQDYAVSTLPLRFDFRSYYFFRDNSKSSWYVATDVGLRRTRSVGKLQSTYEAPSGYHLHAREGTGPLPERVVATKCTAPIGLRFGIRGGLRGFFADFHMGGGLQVGGTGRDTEVVPVLWIPRFHPYYLRVGFAMGGGWGGRT